MAVITIRMTDIAPVKESMMMVVEEAVVTNTKMMEAVETPILCTNPPTWIQKWEPKIGSSGEGEGVIMNAPRGVIDCIRTNGKV